MLAFPREQLASFLGNPGPNFQYRQPVECLNRIHGLWIFSSTWSDPLNFAQILILFANLHDTTHQLVSNH